MFVCAFANPFAVFKSASKLLVKCLLLLCTVLSLLCMCILLIYYAVFEKGLVMCMYVCVCVVCVCVCACVRVCVRARVYVWTAEISRVVLG